MRWPTFALWTLEAADWMARFTITIEWALGEVNRQGAFTHTSYNDFEIVAATHGSWLNQAEIEIGIFSRQCLGQRRIEDLSTLRRETAAWKRRINREGINIAWRFDRKAARKKFGYKRPVIRRSKN